METALQYYEEAQDYMSLVRVYCFCNNMEKVTRTTSAQHPIQYNTQKNEDIRFKETQGNKNMYIPTSSWINKNQYIYMCVCTEARLK